MRLLKLSLKNFKGIKEFELNTQGKNVSIFGDNATGKTTLFDAFLWLLFDKDSQGQSQFDIKTLDENNEPIHGLEHEVEGIFEIDGKEVSLRKVYYEKWTKKRGSAEKIFSGHTTDYYISGVPTKKSEYDAYIAGIVDEDIFKLLTNPMHFNEQLHWQDRRRILLEVCGDVSNEEVLSEMKEGREGKDRLTFILASRDLDKHRDAVKSKQKKINNDLEKIPVRIDEVIQGLPDIEFIDVDGIKAEIDILRSRKKKKEQELTSIESGGAIAEKKKQLAEIETELENIKREHTAEYEQKIEQKKKELSNIESQLDDIEREIRKKKQENGDIERRIEKLGVEIEKLRNKWHEVNDEQFNEDENDTCPYCHRPLPEAMIEKAKKTFNKKKAEKLEEITAEGKEIKAEIEELLVKDKELEEEIHKLEEQYEYLAAEESTLSDSIVKLKEEADEYQDTFEYKKKLAEKYSIEKTIDDLKSDISAAVSDVKNEINDIELQISALEKKLTQVEQFNRGQKRIRELKAREKELAREYEKLEQELYLCEEFIRTKVNLLEEKINSRFKMARFRLFEEQVNGGLKETCETLYNGVPYSSLNNGARINVGLDIINTLADYYQFEAPIFVDNAEAVTQLIETRGQLIKLVVSERDKKLRVEVE